MQHFAPTFPIWLGPPESYRRCRETLAAMKTLLYDANKYNIMLLHAIALELVAYNLSHSYNNYSSNWHTPSNSSPFSVTQMGCLSIVLSPPLSLVHVLTSSTSASFYPALPDGPLDHPNAHAPLDRDAWHTTTALSLSSLCTCPLTEAPIPRSLYLCLYGSTRTPLMVNIYSLEPRIGVVEQTQTSNKSGLRGT